MVSRAFLGQVKPKCYFKFVKDGDKFQLIDKGLKYGIYKDAKKRKFFTRLNNFVYISDFIMF
jgi:hypothetical protein